MKSIQETYAPQNRCFGCGPSNDKGLRIRSFEEGDELICEWRPQPHHLAFENVLNGGICGALLGAKLSPNDAACLGAWLCGRAAELAVFNGHASEESLLPRDLLDHLGGAFTDLRATGHALP